MGTEKIVNGGFETGDLTGWTVDNANISPYMHHSGLYSCDIKGYPISSIQQTLNIKLSVIQSFGFWWNFTCLVHVTFSDSSTYTKGYVDYSSGTWHYVDLKTLILTDGYSPNLYITKITFTGGYNESWIDDVSLIESISSIETSYGLDVILVKRLIRGTYCEKCGKVVSGLYRIQNQDFCKYEFLCKACWDYVTNDGRSLPYP